VDHSRIPGVFERAREAVVAMVCKYLDESNQLRRTGKINFEISLREGGVTGKTVNIQFQEK